MNIKAIPGNFAQMLAFSSAYEAEHFGRTQGTEAVGTATRELFAGWFSPLPARLTRTAVHALCDPPLLAAFGWEPAPAVVVRAAEAAIRTRSRLVRVLPDRRRPHSAVKNPFLKTDPASPPERLGPTGARLPGATEPRDRIWA